MINQFRTELKYGELAQLVLNGIAFPVHGKNVARVRRWQVVCTRTAECWVGRVIKRNNNCRGFQFPGFSECSLRSFVSSWEKDGAFITREEDIVERENDDDDGSSNKGWTKMEEVCGRCS